MKSKLLAGYTLIELTIVISIIGILIAVSIPAFNSFLAPQELKTATLQVKNDLRALQNKAASGISQKRNVDIADNNIFVSTDVRVYWAVKFTNGSGSYSLGACQRNEVVPHRGTESESWNSCSDKTIISLPKNSTLTTCAGSSSSCGNFVLYFTPIYSQVEIYSAADFDTTPPNPSSEIPGPFIITVSSQLSQDKQSILTVNKDGSLAESCKSSGVLVKCN